MASGPPGRPLGSWRWLRLRRPRLQLTPPGELAAILQEKGEKEGVVRFWKTHPEPTMSHKQVLAFQAKKFCYYHVILMLIGSQA